MRMSWSIGEPMVFRGRFNQPETQIAGWKLNAIEVSRHPALGGKRHDAAGMGILLLLLIIGIAKADSLGPER